jgi:hypothetical protein
MDLSQDSAVRKQIKTKKSCMMFGDRGPVREQQIKEQVHASNKKKLQTFLPKAAMEFSVAFSHLCWIHSVRSCWQKDSKNSLPGTFFRHISGHCFSGPRPNLY